MNVQHVNTMAIYRSRHRRWRQRNGYASPTSSQKHITDHAQQGLTLIQAEPTIRALVLQPHILVPVVLLPWESLM